MTFGIKRLQDGTFAVVHRESGEVMHPVAGPWREAAGLYVAGSELSALLRSGKEGAVVVFDVGLGAAANALAALSCQQETAAASPGARALHIVSFERDLDALTLAIDEAAALVYPLPYLEVLRTLLGNGSWRGPGGNSWEVRVGDFTRLVHDEPRRADVVFFDPFSPAANPDMWSVPVFEGLFRCRRPGGDLRLVTYSAAFSTRAALLLAGFFVGEGPRVSPRRRTTVSSTLYAGLHDPLSTAWLRRWQHDGDPWPRMSPPRTRPALRGALADHPQWLQQGGGSASPDESPPVARPRRRRRSARGGTAGRDAPPRRGEPQG